MNQRRFLRQRIPDRQAIARLVRVCRRELALRELGRLACSWAVLVGAAPGPSGYVHAWWTGLQMMTAQARDRKKLSDALNPGGSSTPK